MRALCADWRNYAGDTCHIRFRCEICRFGQLTERLCARSLATRAARYSPLHGCGLRQVRWGRQRTSVVIAVRSVNQAGENTNAMTVAGLVVAHAVGALFVGARPVR